MNGLISLCMIVKNEEDLLARCLSSMKAYVDEIVIVDTGSTDRTKEIAFQYTKLVFDWTWTNDFGAARNEALRNATGRWILILDADEYMMPESITGLISQLKHLDTSRPTVLMGSVHNLVGNNASESGVYISSAARVFTNHQRIHYQGAIHEQLAASGKTLIYVKSDFSIIHSGYMKETWLRKNKSERNLSILSSLDKDTINQPYYQYMLANEYYMLEQYDLALPLIEKAAAQAASNQPWYHSCTVMYITLLMLHSQYETAWVQTVHGMEHFPDYVDYFCLGGMVLHAIGQYEYAAELLSSCLNREPKSSGGSSWLVHSDYAQTLPRQHLLEIYRKTLQTSGCYEMLKLQLKENPLSFNKLVEFLSIAFQYYSHEETMNDLAQLYVIQDPSHLFLLFRASSEAGHVPFVHLFYNLCTESMLPLPAEDQMRYALYCKNEQLYIKHNQAFITSSSQDQVNMYRWISDRLWKQSKQPWQADDECTLNLLIRLFNLQMFECFDDLLPACNVEVISQFADYLFHMHYAAIAYDYYVMLLEADHLHLNGYHHFVQILILNEQFTDAVSLAEQALLRQYAPALYGVYLGLCMATRQQAHKALESSHLQLITSILNYRLTKE